MTRLWWIPLAGGDLGVEHGVLRAREVQALEDARALQALVDREVRAQRDSARRDCEEQLHDAQAHAQAIVQQAQQQADALREQARADGLRDAIEQWNAHALVQSRTTQEMVHGMYERLAAIVADTVATIVVATDRAELYDRALALVRDSHQQAGRLTLKVAPADLPRALAWIARIGAQSPELAGAIAAEADGRMSAGGCVVDTDFGTIDVSLDSQLAALRQVLVRHLAAAPLPENDEGGVPDHA